MPAKITTFPEETRKASLNITRMTGETFIFFMVGAAKDRDNYKLYYEYFQQEKNLK